MDFAPTVYGELLQAIRKRKRILRYLFPSNDRELTELFGRRGKFVDRGKGALELAKEYVHHEMIEVIRNYSKTCRRELR